MGMFTLELFFLNEEAKSVKIKVDDPRSDVTGEELATAMASIIAADVFTSSGGNLVSAVGAKVIERNVTEVEIA
jgi:hypothetical protein